MKNKIWMIAYSLFLIFFITNRFFNNSLYENYLSIFKCLKFLLYLYFIRDFIRLNLTACRVDSQISYLLVVIICLIFLIPLIYFFSSLDYNRISEFFFFALFVFLIRIIAMEEKKISFLRLKDK